MRNTIAIEPQALVKYKDKKVLYVCFEVLIKAYPLRELYLIDDAIMLGKEYHYEDIQEHQQEETNKLRLAARFFIMGYLKGKQ